ncbi:hypothetical protein MITSMUL_04840 [Mitsuokella multacida DSM 20544]|uniref:Uncharacterized protein n=1 Tax=Mitsuokella multacida DSM 20544 TaxID=500635 RepID=C9KN30_9FIRM|nr:hypothetical protein MITSMUL_04840 [Mitsuokella multacida DSM 20544]
MHRKCRIRKYAKAKMGKPKKRPSKRAGGWCESARPFEVPPRSS